jgi:hypothetical protein
MRMEEGNIVFGNGTYQKTDGSVAILGDVGLQKESPQPQVFVYPLEEGAASSPGENPPVEEIAGHLLATPTVQTEDATTIDHLVQQLLSDIAAGPPATAEAASTSPMEIATFDHPAPVLAPLEEADFLI